jgi:hypothetical protein
VALKTARCGLLGAANTALKPAHIEVRRLGQWMDDERDYIPFKATLAAAAKAGQPVGDYIDAVHCQPGTTREAVARMAELGAFAGPIGTVCEIGAGSGAYSTETDQAFHAHVDQRFHVMPIRSERSDALAFPW